MRVMMKFIVVIFVWCFTSKPIKCYQLLDDSTKIVNIECGSLFLWPYESLECIDRSPSAFMSLDTTINGIVDESGFSFNPSTLRRITSLNLDGKTVNYIPKGIAVILSNLKTLTCNNCELVSIEKHDLEQFGSNLEEVQLKQNLLTSLDANLFMSNPNLQSLEVEGNPLKYIEPGFFESLNSIKSLRFVNFKFCECISQVQDSRFHRIVKLNLTIWQDSKCRNDNARIEYILMKIKKYSHEINNLEQQIMNFTQVNVKHTEKTNQDIQRIETSLAFTKVILEHAQTYQHNLMHQLDNLCFVTFFLFLLVVILIIILIRMYKYLTAKLAIVSEPINSVEFHRVIK